MDNLIGTKLLFTVSEPWAFEDDNGFCSFEVEVMAVEGDSLFLQGSQKVRIGSSEYDSFICSPRLEGGSISQLKNKLDLWCSSTALPQDKANSTNPFDLSWWRGGGALIGSLSVR